MKVTLHIIVVSPSNSLVVTSKSIYKPNQAVSMYELDIEEGLAFRE